MLTVWRMVKQQRVADAFSGEGARLFGGRWNSGGLPFIYAAESRALAALEILVHVDDGGLMEDYLCIPVRFDRRLMQRLASVSLPGNWRTSPPPRATQRVGDEWAREARSVVLEVPSVLIPGESNYLINPRHPGFKKLKIGVPEPFAFDSRLSK